MKWMFAMLVVLFPVTLPAQAVQWFTVTGDRNDSSVDTTELDVSTVQKNASLRTFRFRVSLSKPRQDAAGQTYQSYLSHITVDCNTSSIFHDDQVRYRNSGWTGPEQHETFAQPKPMAFGGLVPDPRQRLLAAACHPRFR